MKKCYTLVVLFLAITLAANSQITIGQSDMPTPGDTIRLSTTTDTVGLPNFTLTGANYTWDFSGLKALSQTIDTFVTVSSTLFVYQLYFNDPILYPAYTATVAQTAPNPPTINPITITNVDDYYKTTSSAYENVGFGADIMSIPTSVKDDTIDYVYHFPMNYGNADSCNSSYHMSIPVLGYYGEHQHRVNHVDGWGILITPYGTFPTLRVITELYTTDTLHIDSLHYGFATPTTEQIQYKWLAAGKAVPLLQVNEAVVLGFPVISSIVYRDSARDLNAGLEQIATLKAGVRVFPNPSKNMISFITQVTLDNADITLYDMMGQSVLAKHYNLLNKGNEYNIDLNFLASGMYYLHISSSSGADIYKIVKE